VVTRSKHDEGIAGLQLGVEAVILVGLTVVAPEMRAGNESGGAVGLMRLDAGDEEPYTCLACVEITIVDPFRNLLMGIMPNVVVLEPQSATH
jgi:hypothetical protein